MRIRVTLSDRAMTILRTMGTRAVEDRGGLVRAGIQAWCGADQTSPSLVVRLEQACLIRPAYPVADQSYIPYQRTPFGDDVVAGKAIDMPDDLVIGLAMSGWSWEQVAPDPASG